MPNLPLPSENTNILRLADWMELSAVVAADENFSKGDIESALSVASVFRREKQDEKILEVFAELQNRSRAAQEAYPYTINGAVLQFRGDKTLYSAYLFCLALSYFGWSTKRAWEIDINPWLLFEELSAMAAARFLDGEVYRFGTSRAVSNTKGVFVNSINELCVGLGEGRQYRPQPSRWKKDDRVDLVAWKNFRDSKTSKLIMFGQCAAGHDFTDKLSDLDPDAFWRKWMSESNVSPPIKSFYIPHRVPSVDWDNYGRDCGILFDRCRVSYWAFQQNVAITSDARFRRWFRHILRYQKPKPKPTEA